MQLRCNIQLDNGSRKVVFVSQENETDEHLALKLAAFVLFFGHEPMAEISSKNPAMAGQEFRPDLVALNDAGEIKLWIECGNVTVNKMDKLIRRYREARIVVLKETVHEAQNLRKMLAKNDIAHSERIEVLAFPGDSFKEWFRAIEETVEIVGEAGEKSFNLVVNAVPLSFDFQAV
jgi:uncharacterized protein YaeQ